MHARQGKGVRLLSRRLAEDVEFLRSRCQYKRWTGNKVVFSEEKLLGPHLGLEAHLRSSLELAY